MLKKCTFHILVGPVEILCRKPVTGVGRVGDVRGMGSKVTTGEKSYKKRTEPISVNELIVADTEQPGTSLTITKREKDNFQKSVEAYGRASERPHNEERVKKDLALFETAYTTTYRFRKPKEGDPYWEVNTSSIKEPTKGYLNRFKLDGEIVCESNYHPKEHPEESISNSSALWCQHQFLLAKSEVKLVPITRLRRLDVSNEQTNDTSRVCFLMSAEMAEFPGNWRMSWPPGAMANALCGTPNGLAAVYLVKDWGKLLGLEGIESVMVDKPGVHANRQVHLVITFSRDEGIDIPKGKFF